MTYEVDGKQYVVTVNGGPGSFGTKLGDYVPAYALSETADAGWLGNLEVLLRHLHGFGSVWDQITIL